MKVKHPLDWKFWKLALAFLLVWGATNLAVLRLERWACMRDCRKTFPTERPGICEFQCRWVRR